VSHVEVIVLNINNGQTTTTDANNIECHTHHK